MRSILRLFFVAVLLTSPSVSAAADEPLPGAPKADFLFGEPLGWVAVRGTWLVPRAGGDLFGFVDEHLTIDQPDYQTPAFLTQLGVKVTSRLSMTGDVEFSTQTIGSEYRDFVDNLGLPINQTTKLTQTNLAVGFRLFLVEPGRSISRLAYVPRTFVPYVGAGAGMYYYQFEQTGDFVDAVTSHVFFDHFQSTGWTPSAHIVAGTGIRVWRTVSLDVEGRYVFAKGDLQRDFVGFDGIDLNGFRLSFGFDLGF